MAIPTPAVSESDLEERDLTDVPLDPVVQDNLDLDLQIGPGPLDSDNKPVNGRPYYVTELEVHLTKGSESNYAMGRLVPDGHSRKPSPGDPLERGSDPDIISIDIDNLLTEERDDTDGEITRIFTGVISNASRIERGMFEFMAFWPGYNQIQNGTSNFSLPPPEEQINIYNGREYLEPKYQNSSQYAKVLARDVAETITEDSPFGFDVFLVEGGWTANGITYGDNQHIAMDSFDVPITAASSDEGALQRIVKATNSVWEIDRYGRFFIGPPLPDNDEFSSYDIPTKVQSHKLRYITDTTAGKQSPAWNSIVVIGDGVVSQDGWSASAQINDDQFVSSSPLTREGIGSGAVSESLAEPTFRYVNLEINTATEAKHVLNELKEEIREQSAGGTITVVGHPEVWPGDAIEMPDTTDQPFGRERYGVGKVIHRLNNTDGFLTKIEVVGQTNANEAVWSDEVPTPEDTGQDLYDFQREGTRSGR